MVSVAEFSFPNGDNPTLCERNSQVINGINAAAVLDYRKILSKELLSQSKSLTVLETMTIPAFIPVELGLVERIYENWTAKGLIGVFEEVQKSPEVPSLIANISSKAYKYGVYISEWRSKNEGFKDTETEKKHSLIVCHPHTPSIAVVIQDKVKVVCLNRLDSDHEIILRDKRIRSVTCLAWRPKASMSIAVGSDNGVLIWLLDPNFTNKRPGVSATRYLQSPEMTCDVSSISWSNCGKLLACTFKNSAAFWIWNVISQNGTAIQRVGSNLSFTKWSPCGQRLLTTTTSGVFRIWETKTWDCVKWAGLNGKCTNACWSSCGTCLLFTVANEPIIYYTKFYPNKNSETIDIGGTGVAVKCADLGPFLFSKDGDDISIGGSISCLEWDPTNSRLAVVFKGEEHNQPYIALFHTQLKPQLQLVPCGFINGDIGEIPYSVKFINGYDKGALLAICWSNKSLSLVPLYFNQNLSSPIGMYGGNAINGSTSLSATMQQQPGEDFSLNCTNMNNDFSIYSSMD